jgi:diketogulonate reductase-like aldo/keto reductase
MAAKILSEMSVGLTPEIAKALNVATEFSGLKPSQYGRMAILERLVREGFLRHPGISNYENSEAAE